MVGTRGPICSPFLNFGAFVKMASSASDLEYDHASKKRFKEYFLQPKPKRGRPKKKKRGRPKKSKSKSTAQTKITSSKRKTIDLTIDENRDSSAINQAFDKFVAREGKRRAALCLAGPVSQVPR